MTTLPLDWLRPPAVLLPDAVRVDDVGPVGWQVLLRDGALEPVWADVAAPAGRPAGPAVRALAVRSLVPPRAVLGREGAVWLHTGGAVPLRFDVLVEPKVRRPSPHPVRVPHECALPESDVVRVGVVRVTTVPRTALDVARWLPERRAHELLRRLLRYAGPDALPPASVTDPLSPRERDRVRAVLAAATSAGPAESPG